MTFNFRILVFNYQRKKGLGFAFTNVDFFHVAKRGEPKKGAFLDIQQELKIMKGILSMDPI